MLVLVLLLLLLLLGVLMLIGDGMLVMGLLVVGVGVLLTLVQMMVMVVSAVINDARLDADRRLKQVGRRNGRMMVSGRRNCSRGRVLVSNGGGAHCGRRRVQTGRCGDGHVARRHRRGRGMVGVVVGGRRRMVERLQLVTKTVYMRLVVVVVIGAHLLS